MPRKKAETPKKNIKEQKVVNRRVDTSSVDDLANCVVANPNLVSQFKALGFRSKNPEGMTFKEAMICSQIASAIKGDLRSYRAVMDYADKQKEMIPLEDYVQGNSGLAMEDLIGG